MTSPRNTAESPAPLLVRPRRIAPRGGVGEAAAILLEDGRITALGADALRRGLGAACLEADDLVAIPGMIDLQCNGAFGRGVAEDPEALWTWTEGLAAHGVTAVLPTLISSPPERIARALETWRRGPAPRRRGPRIPGLHLEGPFLAAGRAGAHEARHLRAIDPGLARDWSPERGVAMVTLAPELEGAPGLIRTLADRGVLVSLGHSDARHDEVAAAVEAGARCVTHLFNAMAGLHHREPGLAGAALALDALCVGLIADGLHVDARLFGLVRRCKGPGRVVLVTDAMSGLGMPPGRHRLGDQDVTVAADGARLADGTLAGSVLRLDRALGAWMTHSGAGLDEAVDAVTRVPAALLGLELGTIAVGRPADLVLLDDGLAPRVTVVAGEVVFDDR